VCECVCVQTSIFHQQHLDLDLTATCTEYNFWVNTLDTESEAGMLNALMMVFSFFYLILLLLLLDDFDFYLQNIG